MQIIRKERKKEGREERKEGKKRKIPIASQSFVKIMCKKSKTWGWGDGLLLKCTGCSC